MKADTTFWLEQAAYIDKIMENRSKEIAVELIRDELEWNRHKACVMEDWKNNVESQRQGLEVQVGELERQRQELERQLIVVRKTASFKIIMKLEAFLIPEGSRRRRFASKIYRGLRKVKRKLLG